jgi:amino-acid N-acetyltransferase
MDEEIVIAPAQAGDLDAIHKILTDAGLPTAGVEENLRTFIVARAGDRIIACGGAEAHQFAALIRSVAVVPDHQKSGIGRRIVRQLLDRLASRGLREFYVLTTTAEEYFRKRGFKTIDRDEVHPQLLSSREFQDACPASAVAMRLVMLV